LGDGIDWAAMSGETLVTAERIADRKMLGRANGSEVSTIWRYPDVWGQAYQRLMDRPWREA
jgi:hypothetical protein